MIKFFRTIRKNLIEQSKVRNYFFYAIGEIFLVVIGILIALQINNWNEEKKSSKFESEILKLISQNLERDSVMISIELKKALTATALTDRVLKAAKEKTYSDSIPFWLGKIITFERFQSQSSGYEVLKSKGFDVIKNKNLQTDLISYYDSDLFNMSQGLNDVLGAFNTDWIPILKSEFSDFRWMEYAEPRDYKLFFNNQTHLMQFKLYQDNREGSIDKMVLALDKIAIIKSQIDLAND
ncbi:DUF6090 family protein [Nonlabens marinus]|uniref:Uncharacterized protein n=1 Tax=Nonlabens marinus S1-08 TaxID=1454201 RepID=W8VWZ6_9FLAO|nr:DUF6090 family protein [Nonlabens marinus]BAO56773.1 hypothetical protein NMS_2764 [Nonlabens marinus S1-08]